MSEIATDCKEMIIITGVYDTLFKMFFFSYVGIFRIAFSTPISQRNDYLQSKHAFSLFHFEIEYLQVKTFMVRIRYLKSNKEAIKFKLGQHDLLPKMSQVYVPWGTENWRYGGGGKGTRHFRYNPIWNDKLDPLSYELGGVQFIISDRVVPEV